MTESELAVGIDLGTTYSAVAFLDNSGRPQTLINAEGDKLTPSTMLFDGQSVIVGKEAVKALGDRLRKYCGSAETRPRRACLS